MKFISKKDLVIPKRKKSSHKGDNGKVLIIGGSRDYVGAVALAGLAALRTGVDWVTVAVPEKVGWAINALTPDLVVKKYKGDDFQAKHVKDLLKLAEGFDIVLIGNGIGIKAKSFCKTFLKKIKKPCVIDADAIKAINIQSINNCILTPHEREFDILLKNSKLTQNNLKKNLKNNVILLKGFVDQIISKKKTAYNETGNPGMTKAGTGDVLAGLAAGFYAQLKDPFKAAVNTAYINGLLGDLQLKKKKGYSYIASDLLEDIKKVLK